MKNSNSTEITNMNDSDFENFFYKVLSKVTKEPLPVGLAIQKVLDNETYKFEHNSPVVKRIWFLGFKSWEVGKKDWYNQVLEGVQERLEMDPIRAIHNALTSKPSNSSELDEATSRRLDAHLKWQDDYFFKNGYTD
jgi:hypothetical protein